MSAYQQKRGQHMTLGEIIGLFVGKYYLRFSTKIKLERLYYQWLKRQTEELKKDNPDSSCVVADSPFSVFSFLDSYNLLDIEKVEEYLIEQKGEENNDYERDNVGQR